MTSLPEGSILPRNSPLVGFLRHSPAQALHGHFAQLCHWRSRHGTSQCDQGAPDEALKRLPNSPYVGFQRHAPPSPILSFKKSRFAMPPDFSIEEESLEDDFKLPPALAPIEESSVKIPDTVCGNEKLPEEAWVIALSFAVDITRIACLSRVARGFSELLKSEMVWAQRSVLVPPSTIASLAPVLGAWLPAWRQASKIIVPRSTQFMAELSQQMPNLPIEVAWRFDPVLKGEGVEVTNHGRSVRRVAGATEELVVLGDAPIPQTSAGSAKALLPYLEVTIEDRSADNGGDEVNDLGIGFTASAPSDIAELGSVADEVPLSWVVDFTKSSIVLVVNNKEAAQGTNLSGDHLNEGSRVGLRVTTAGSVEVFLDGKLWEHLVPVAGDCIPQGVELFPVFDLYGCTAQISRTDADRPL